MKRNFGLDVLRAISIWLVLLAHAGVNIPGLKPIKMGAIGVEVFFVLSGFLIGGILLRELDRGENLKTTLKRFWIRRWFRIIPLYYAVLLFKFIFIDHSIGANILYYVFFLQNNFYGISFLDVSWSLVIEEWFYLTCPIFLFFSIKIFKSDKKVFLAIIGFILSIVLLRACYVIFYNAPYQGIHSNFLFRFDSLFLGVLLSFIRHKGWDSFRVLSTRLVFFIGLFLFIGYIYLFWSMGNPVYRIDQLLFPRIFGFLLLPLTISLMIPYVSELEFRVNRNIFNRFYRGAVYRTSILTYALYLIHPFVFGVFLKNDSFGPAYVQFFLAIISSYVIAELVYRFFENPILKFRDRITMSPKGQKVFSNSNEGIRGAHNEGGSAQTE